MFVRNDTTFFCNIMMFFDKLQFCFVSYYFLLCRIMLFCIITMLYCVLPCCFVMILHSFPYYNDILCPIMLFCIIIILSVFPNIVLCLFMLYYNITILQYYCLCFNFMSYHILLLFCV